MLVSPNYSKPSCGNTFHESFEKINILINALKSENSQKGKWTDVYEAINNYNILEDHAVITALKNVPHFYDLYVQHFIDKKKELPHFRNMLSSFCASWIKRLYLEKYEKK